MRVEAADDSAALDVDRAIHLGLVVNELLTNAIKHAFPKGRPGDVVVSIRTLGDQVRLQIGDNGRGLPASVVLKEAKSVGLRTVHLLLERLRAQVTIQREGGTTFTLTLPMHLSEPAELPL